MPGLIAAAGRLAGRLAGLLTKRPGRSARYGYDLLNDNKRRKPPLATIKSEDDELDAANRRKLVATGWDVARNFALASWAIRRHLDYVASFSFQSRTGNEAFDRRLESLVAWWGRPANFDVARRRGRRRFLRLAEAGRTVAGDVFTLKLSSGHLQPIESDRIRNPIGRQPGNVPAERLVHGVITTKAGAPRGYCLHNRRRGGGYQFDRVIPARNMLAHGYYDRFDQIRGVGLIAPGIATLQDAYEGIGYALAKAKVCQLFGLKIRQEEDEAVGKVTGEDSDGDGTVAKSDYTVDFGRGPFVLDLGVDEDADFIESKHPSTEFREFLAGCIMIALKAVDIPFSFFDEGHSTYSGSRQAWLQYEHSAADKRQDNRELLEDLTRWRVALWILDGTLTLPRSVGRTVEDIAFTWQARGIPWIDPLKEVKADVAAVDARLTSRQRVTARQGGDWWEIIDELDAEQERLAKSPAAAAPAAAPQQTSPANANA